MRIDRSNLQSRLTAGGSKRRNRGSVLVPVVAAMLILSLCSLAMAELIGAQRYQAVLGIESSQAHWIAEAGARQAAYDGTSLPTPVAFAGGSYSVVKSGDIYTSTGVFGEARRVVTLDATGAVGGGGGGGPTTSGPLDEIASAGSAQRRGFRRIQMELVSDSPEDAEISSFALSDNRGFHWFRRLQIGGRSLWRTFFGVQLPTGTLALNAGSASQRTVQAGSSPQLVLEFTSWPSGSIDYTLVLNFADGTSSSLQFTIDW